MKPTTLQKHISRLYIYIYHFFDLSILDFCSEFISDDSHSGANFIMSPFTVYYESLFSPQFVMSRA